MISSGAPPQLKIIGVSAGEQSGCFELQSLKPAEEILLNAGCLAHHRGCASSGSSRASNFEGRVCLWNLCTLLMAASKFEARCHAMVCNEELAGSEHVAVGGRYNRAAG